MNRISRAVARLNNQDALMINTHFYDWLRGHYTGNLFGDIRAYVNTFSAVSTTWRIDRDVLQGLEYVHAHYFYVEVV